MDIKTFAIIILITTIVSYIIIRKFFKIAPRFLMYGILGMVAGVVIGTSIAWPMSALLGQFGVVTAPYILGLILIIFIEFFIIEGKRIIEFAIQRYGARI
mgnify:CR=1 FL=1